MASPPLRLEEISYDRVIVNARRDFDTATDEEGEFHTSVRFAQSNDDESLWRVDLRIEVMPKTGAPPPKYEIDVRAIGVFRVHPEFPTDRMSKMVGVTATSILYSGLRDFVMSVTARGPWGTVMLPTTSFIDVEPSTGSGVNTMASAIQKALEERGPLRIRAMAEALSVSVDAIRPVIANLRGRGLVETVGRGAGTTYRLSCDIDMHATEEAR